VTLLLAQYFHDREVLDWCRRAEDLDPDAFFTRWNRQMAHLSLDEWDEGIAALPAALDRARGSSLPGLLMGLTHQAKGHLRAVRDVYDELLARSKREYISAIFLTALADGAGNRDAARKHLREAVRRRDPTIVKGLSGWAWIEPLQALPEFQAILRDIGVTRWAEREASGTPLECRCEKTFRGAARTRTGDRGFAVLCLTNLATAPSTQRGAASGIRRCTPRRERETGLEPATPTLARLCSTN
jgi:tetratricopeptide (TPR) repeat protein